MYLFKPFNTIINGIHKIGEGDYDFKVSAIAGKELVILSESVNNLSNEVSKREFLLKEFNRILEDKNLKLEEMDKIKDSFLANTSHELRTPINGIIGLSESLMAGIAGDLNDKAKFNLDMIISSGRRLLHLINDILDFSKMNKKELTLEKNPLNIKNISESVGLMCHSLIGRKNIELINEIEESFPLVEGDQNRLEQVFYNLIGNAIKFTDKGYVKISAVVKEEKAEICVEDTGIGISRDKFDRIFVSFEQLEDSENRQYGGTGLGLSITRELVKIMGGEIYLESEEGVGSKFYFTLPISKEMFAVNKELKRESFQKSSVINNKDPQKKSDKNNYSELSEDTNRVFNVLIVDDEPINVQVLMNHLMMEKIQPDIAENGFDALEKIEQKNYDLILLDIMMPKMSGYEVARKLREKYTSFELPILILTAKNQIEDIVEGFEAGANDYLTKPFEQRELIARVFTLLELKKSLEIAEFNSRKYEMEKQKRVLAEKLREINNELTSTLFLEKVFEKLFDSIAEYVEYDRYYSLFKTYDGYEIFNHKGEFKTSFKNLKIFEENRMIKELKESKLPIFIKNIERSLIIEDEFEVKQVVGIPVMYREELMGVIIFENMVEKEYNKSGLEIVFTIAGQAGIAIENARLFQKLIETFNKLKSIEEMVSVIYAEENRDIAVNYIIKTMTGKLGIKFNKAEYFEYDMLKHEIILKNEMFSVLNDDVERKIGRIKLSQSKLLKTCIDSGDELFEKNDTVFDLPDEFGYKEEYTAILPVVYEHNVYGLLFIEAASDEDFMKVKNEKELLKIFSKNLSIYLENRKLEENGRKVDKLETFIKLSSAIVHEVKTPLVGIKGFAEMTKKKYLDDKKIQMYMDKIINETQRVDEMAVQLLEYAGNGAYIYNFKPTDLKMLIEKVVESKKGEISINSIRLVLDLEEIELECDEEQMIVAFNNILKNAIEASKGNDDMIKIATERKDGKVSIVFEDKGVGILKDISDKVFEPLITTKVQGTGLGLPIVMNIIKAHNGTVVLNSKEGEGTKVTVVLPRRVLR